MRALWYNLLIVTVTMASCASDPQYPAYVLDPAHDSLRAHTQKEDLPMAKTCAPDDKVKAKCMVMLIDQYYAELKELLELRKQVQTLEKGPKPAP